MTTVDATELADVKVITPRRFGDARGFFSEVWNKRALEEAGIAIDFVQDNHSRSEAVGTLRGLHYQAPPAAQDKLVRVVKGGIFDVAVDFRKSSPTFGKWVGVELTEDNWKQLLVPRGFLHGFVTLSPNTEVIYKCSAPYAPELEGSVRFDDPDLAIDWGMPAAGLTLSGKDAAAPAFAQVTSPFD